ncbi:MAG: hypothetical protein AAF327_11470 [Cyanobacteria bacterium P01_A01_bin.37]
MPRSTLVRFTHTSSPSRKPSIQLRLFASVAGAIACIIAFGQTTRANISNSYLTQAKEGCDRQSGTLHLIQIENEAWMCLYGNLLPDSERLGIYHTPEGDHYQFVLQQTPEGSDKLVLEPLSRRQSTDD